VEEERMYASGGGKVRVREGNKVSVWRRWFGRRRTRSKLPSLSPTVWFQHLPHEHTMMQ
jgi:hypothetical protein